MSFAPVDGQPRARPGAGQPKQRRDEGSREERSIKANIQEMQESMRQASDQLERAQRGFFSKRCGESLDKCLSRSRELAEETETLFRDWTVAMAGEPTERHRKKFSFEKLQKAFEQEVAHLRELARQAVTAQQEAADRPLDRRSMEFQPMCGEQDDSLNDDEVGLLDDSSSAQAAVGSSLAATEDINVTNRIAQDREDGIRRIQNQVAEVNSIFRDLASIVTEQGQQFETIENCAESASVNTKEATREVKKANDRQKLQREHLCCLLIACIVILSFVVFPHLHVGSLTPVATEPPGSSNGGFLAANIGGASSSGGTSGV